MPLPRDANGQASVELVALMPLVGLVVLALWQAVLVGQAVWSSAGAARAAARAQAVGRDPLAAARGAVPGTLRAGIRVSAAGAGVRVHVPVPLAFTNTRLTTIEARAALPPQR
ncbi:MAG: hypothetical protein QOF12_1622 [Solirubrobacteraceae bacterium]|jgi:hypothetical protein|nr:hypothetical protein [Solirubrobacteraceae bacterium]